MTVYPIVFTAYSVTSAYLSEGVCVTTSGEAITLDTPYSFLPPKSVASSDFQRAAGFSFIDYLGFSTCRGSGDAIVPTPLAGNGTSVSVLSLSVVSSSPTSTAVSSQPSAPNSPAQPRLDSKAKVGVGISVPIALAGLVFLGFFV